MKQFKAIEIQSKPFIQWHEWAKDLPELTELDEYFNPLIVGEINIPPYQFGVCPWKIENGELVERSADEMAIFEREFVVKQKVSHQKATISEINKGTFSFEENVFPMDEASRFRYMAMSNVVADNVKVMKVNGDSAIINSGKIPFFMQAFYGAILEITNLNE